MVQKSVNHGTFVIERVYPISPERVFAAFADPEKKRRWFGEGKELSSKNFTMNFQAGGIESSSSLFSGDSPLPKGTLIENKTIYQDIVPNQRIVMVYTMTVGGRRISASLATIELLPKEKGTLLIFTEQGAYFEHADGPKIREEGWQQLLNRLGNELSDKTKGRD